MIEWKVKFDSYEKQNTMPLDRGKIESLRAIAQELEKLNKTLDTGIGMLIDELSEIKKQGQDHR